MCNDVRPANPDSMRLSAGPIGRGIHELGLGDLAVKFIA
jgi:hypothetical protein